VVVADLAADEGIDAVAGLCATEPLTMLVNNAGVAHYMPLAELPAAKARELAHVPGPRSWPRPDFSPCKPGPACSSAPLPTKTCVVTT
jgi:hypothetical protein